MIEPVSSAIASYVGDKLVEAAESAVRVHVIERWTRHRARQFFAAFASSLLDAGVSDEEIGAKLDELLASESKSEAVFEAYRAVCLSKSKNLGPRIIALLTAELVLLERLSDAKDDLIFSAAEELSDGELTAFVDYVTEQKTKAVSDGKRRPRYLDDGSLEVRVTEESTDSNWLRQDAIAIGPLDLVEWFGLWATKLKRLGLIHDDVRERQWKYEEDSERHVDEPGIAREVTWWLNLSPAALALSTFVERARKGL